MMTQYFTRKCWAYFPNYVTVPLNRWWIEKERINFGACALFSLSTVNNNTEAGAGGEGKGGMFPPSAPLLPIPTSAKASPRAAPQAKGISGWVRHIHSGSVTVYVQTWALPQLFSLLLDFAALIPYGHIKLWTLKCVKLALQRTFLGQGWWHLQALLTQRPSRCWESTPGVQEVARARASTAKTTARLAAAGGSAPSPGPGSRWSSAQQQGEAGPWEIDSLFQALFIIPSTDTDMCLLKGDTVPLTLTLSALVIWDASPGSIGVTFWGEGRDCIYLWGSWKFLTSHASPIIHMLHDTRLALLMQQHHIKKFDFLLWQQACPLQLPKM